MTHCRVAGIIDKMKASYRLDEKDIKEAIKFWMEKTYGIKSAVVSLNFYKTTGNDPREISYVYANVEQP